MNTQKLIVIIAGGLAFALCLVGGLRHARKGRRCGI
jgi:hypothetical protein